MAELLRRDFEAMATRCALFAVDVPASRLEHVEAWVRGMERRLTRFEPSSELSQLNAGAGHWVAVSDEVEAVLRAALAAFEASSGLVNAAVLPSMHAIGYGRTFASGPTAVSEQPALPLRPLPDILEVAPGRARVAPGSGVDVGGIAKGWLADRACDRLGDNSLANLGGDLAARGFGVDGTGWPVAVGGATLLLADQGAATSSTLKRRWHAGGRVLHHLVDPRTGREAATGLAEVSVVAESGEAAEVIAKTALLLGRDQAPAYLAATAAASWLREESPVTL